MLIGRHLVRQRVDEQTALRLTEWACCALGCLSVVAFVTAASSYIAMSTAVPRVLVAVSPAVGNG
jgi:hypothetical protein